MQRNAAIIHSVLVQGNDINEGFKALAEIRSFGPPVVDGLHPDTYSGVRLCLILDWLAQMMCCCYFLHRWSSLCRWCPADATDDAHVCLRMWHSHLFSSFVFIACKTYSLLSGLTSASHAQLQHSMDPMTPPANWSERATLMGDLTPEVVRVSSISTC